MVILASATMGRKTAREVFLGGGQTRCAVPREIVTEGRAARYRRRQAVSGRGVVSRINSCHAIYGPRARNGGVGLVGPNKAMSLSVIAGQKDAATSAEVSLPMP